MARPRDSELDERILRAAQTLLAESGFEGLTMERVAERSGVGKPTVYRRWRSRAHLAFEATTNATMPELPNTGTLRGDLRIAAESLAAALQSLDRSLIADQVAQMISDGDFARIVDQQRLSRDATLMAVVHRRAVERGEIADDARGVELLEDFAAILLYRTLVLHRTIDGDDVDYLVNRFVDGLRLR